MITTIDGIDKNKNDRVWCVYYNTETKKYYPQAIILSDPKIPANMKLYHSDKPCREWCDKANEINDGVQNL